METTDRNCQTCRDHHISLKLPIRKLVLAPTKPKNGTEIWLCPFCDGPALDLARKVARAKRQQD